MKRSLGLVSASIVTEFVVNANLCFVILLQSRSKGPKVPAKRQTDKLDSIESLSLSSCNEVDSGLSSAEEDKVPNSANHFHSLILVSI